jgi:hypothetical protein
MTGEEILSSELHSIETSILTKEKVCLLFLRRRGWQSGHRSKRDKELLSRHRCWWESIIIICSPKDNDQTKLKIMVLPEAPRRHFADTNPLNRSLPHGQTWQRDENAKTSAPSLAIQASRDLRAWLKEYKWMPSPNDRGEQQRKCALQILEAALCRWASNLESMRPTSENRWQRSRGKWFDNRPAFKKGSNGLW